MSNTVYFAAGQSARVSYILKKEEFLAVCLNQVLLLTAIVGFHDCIRTVIDLPCLHQCRIGKSNADRIYFRIHYVLYFLITNMIFLKLHREWKVCNHYDVKPFRS